MAVLALGLSGEASEVLGESDHTHWTKHERDLLVLEIGDVFWYLAMLCHHLSLPLPVVGVPDPNVALGTAMHAVIIHVGVVTECVKKHVGHHKDLDTAKITAAMQQILNHLHVIAVYRGHTDLGTVFSKNIAKLTARYPNGCPF